MDKPDYVLTADSRRARLFQVIEQTGAAGVTELALRELECLVHPERGRLPSEALTDSRPGSQRSSAAMGPGHAVDDHRGAHYQELDRSFAAEIATMLASLEQRPTRLIALAPPKILGLLRKADAWSQSHFAVEELARELGTSSPNEVRDYLRHEGLMR